MRATACFGLILLVFSACKNHSTQKPPAADDSVSSYLPVADLLKMDIKQTDSFATSILQKGRINDRKDSFFIQPGRFHELADTFLCPQLLDSLQFRQGYTENSLMDASTQMISFIYTANSPDNPLRKVLVYVTPSPVTDKVSRIYMEKGFQKGDTAIDQKLTWKIGQYFMIVSIEQPASGPVITSVQTVIWDPLLFSKE